MNPLTVLREAIRAVPAIKFALAVAGVGAVVAIVLGFKLNPQIAVFGSLIVLGLMFILVVFSRYAGASQPAQLAPATVLVWFYTIAVMCATTLLGVSYFFPSWLRKGPVVDLSRIKYFAGSWTHQKTDTVTWQYGACAVSDVMITTDAKLNLNELNNESGIYSGNYVYEYSGKVIRDGTTNHDCRWYQSNRPDYHYKMFRAAAIKCPEQGRCLIDLGEVTCEGDCSDAKNLSFTTTMIVPDASRTTNGFEAINGDGTSLSLVKAPSP